MTNLGDVTIQRLETFMALAEFKKQTAVAVALGIDQATVGRHIRRLEKWLGGAPLFNGNVPAELSPAGEELLKVATEVFRLLHAARSAAVVNVSAPEPRISGKDVQIP